MSGFLLKYTLGVLLLVGGHLCSSTPPVDTFSPIHGFRKRTLSIDLGFESDDSCDDFLLATPRDVNRKKVRSTSTVEGVVPAGPDGGSPGDGSDGWSDSDLYYSFNLMVESPEISEGELTAAVLRARPGANLDTIQFGREHARNRTRVPWWVHDFILDRVHWLPRFYDELAAAAEAQFEELGQIPPTHTVLGMIVDWYTFCIGPMLTRVNESDPLPCHPVPSAGVFEMQLSIDQQKAFFAWIREFRPVVVSRRKMKVRSPPIRPVNAQTTPIVPAGDNHKRSAYMTDKMRKLLVEYMRDHLDATPEDLVAEMQRRKLGIPAEKIRAFGHYIRRRLSIFERIHEYLLAFVTETPESPGPNSREIQALYAAHKLPQVINARRGMEEWIRFCIRPLLDKSVERPCFLDKSRGAGTPIMQLSDLQARALLSEIAQSFAIPRGERTPAPTVTRFRWKQFARSVMPS